jgi:Spy/CpxP family protein refolding chaperone
MKGIKGIVAFWVLAVILAAWGGAYAQDAAPCGHGKGQGGPGKGFLRVLTQLNLTDSQKYDIAGLLRQHREEMQECGNKMFEARKALMEAVTANEFKEQAVREAARRAADVEEERAVLKAKLFNEIRQHLTPEQQETLVKLKADFASRMQNWKAHRMGRMDLWIEENSVRE